MKRRHDWSRLFHRIVTGMTAVMLLLCRPSAGWGTVGREHWTAADMLQTRPAWSVLEYGAFGTGAYPWRQTSPHGRVRVRLDGVPLRSLSPFGPDLESIPRNFIDDLTIRGRREILMNSPLAEGNGPATRTAFHLGQRQQYRFQASIRRQLGDRAGIVIGGSSSGMRGSDTIMGSDARHYMLNYHRILADSARAVINLGGSRDRDGISDLSAGSYMGHRETDTITAAAGLEGIRFGDRSSLSLRGYYAPCKSRIRRYGSTRSLDDDGAGGTVVLETIRGDTRYAARFNYDARFFDSRIHDETWTRHETEAAGTFSWKRGSISGTVDGGLRMSSEYGAEPFISGMTTMRLSQSFSLFLDAGAGGDFPDTGDIYYPALVFGTGTGVADDLGSYRFIEGEGGLRWESGFASAEVAGIGSAGEGIAFAPSIPASVPLEEGERYGGRLSLSSNRPERYDLRGILTWLADTPDDDRHPWPHPSVDARLAGDYLISLVGGRLDATIFCEGRFLRWRDTQGMQPAGNFALVDLGLSITVASLTAFIEVENITATELVWFDAMDWMGRNSIWGVRWNFAD